MLYVNCDRLDESLKRIYDGKVCVTQEEFIFLVGEIASKDEYLFKKLPVAPDYLIDIGANSGYTSIWFHHLYPNAKIIALEPNPDSFERLVYNTKDLPITCINKGLGDGRDLFLQDHGGTGRAFYKDIGNGKGIESITLLSLFEEMGIDGSYYLKVDTEGGEKFLLHSENLPVLLNADYTGIEYHAMDGTLPTDRITMSEAISIREAALTNHKSIFSRWSAGVEIYFHNKY